MQSKYFIGDLNISRNMPDEFVHWLYVYSAVVENRPSYETLYRNEDLTKQGKGQNFCQSMDLIGLIRYFVHINFANIFSMY